MEQSEPRRPQHVARTPGGEQPKEETKTYRVKDGQTWGMNPELQAGDTVELTEKEAASFLDKLELADGSGGQQGTPTQGQLPAGAVSATTETVQPPVVDDSGPEGSPSRTGVPKRPPAN